MTWLFILRNKERCNKQMFMYLMFLGKTDTMIGRDDSTPSLGVIPCAISWLYTLIEDSKQRYIAVVQLFYFATLLCLIVGGWIFF